MINVKYYAIFQLKAVQRGYVGCMTWYKVHYEISGVGYRFAALHESESGSGSEVTSNI